MIGRGELSANARAIASLIEYGQFLKKRLAEIRDEKPILGSNTDLEVEEQLVERELIRVRTVMNSELSSRKAQLHDLEGEGETETG
jgi:hypothetical protein